jgi:peptidoglycan/xylan/chitin deacetylase (PgdA/CDA1 family)
MLLDDFRAQLDDLSQRYEMATLESALDFLQGRYQPARDLCLLTFDDGLKEHFAEVTPLLAARRAQGLFFVITSCAEEGRVAPVHMNHFLMAHLAFEEYQKSFLHHLQSYGLSPLPGLEAVNPPVAASVYPWDTPEAARFKYLFNFLLDAAVRDAVVRRLFQEHLGEEGEFSRQLYLSWDEARQMQQEGMVIGGHSHQHRPLSSLHGPELEADLSLCRQLLDLRLKAQPLWPFCYPYGKNDSFRGGAAAYLAKLGFHCSFTTEPGHNEPQHNLFELRRIDCKQAPAAAAANVR